MAEAEYEKRNNGLINELNKVKKEILINLIVHGCAEDTNILSDSAINHLKDLQAKQYHSYFPQCTSERNEEEVLLMKKLIEQQEGRIGEQVMLISLLREKINFLETNLKMNESSENNKQKERKLYSKAVTSNAENVKQSVQQKGVGSTADDCFSDVITNSGPNQKSEISPDKGSYWRTSDKDS